MGQTQPVHRLVAVCSTDEGDAGGGWCRGEAFRAHRGGGRRTRPNRPPSARACWPRRPHPAPPHINRNNKPKVWCVQLTAGGLLFVFVRWRSMRAAVLRYAQQYSAANKAQAMAQEWSLKGHRAKTGIGQLLQRPDAPWPCESGVGCIGRMCGLPTQQASEAQHRTPQHNEQTIGTHIMQLRPPGAKHRPRGQKLSRWRRPVGAAASRLRRSKMCSSTCTDGSQGGSRGATSQQTAGASSSCVQCGTWGKPFGWV